MFDAVTSVSAEQDAIIKAAAVADYRPAVVGAEKKRLRNWLSSYLIHCRHRE